jgi:hypothetical protein
MTQELASLGSFDPWALYESCMNDAACVQARLAAEQLGHNSYTLTKSVSEHLLWKAAADSCQGSLTIVRPSIVGPSYSFPAPGFAGDRPSTLTACLCLLLTRATRILRLTDQPAPIIPVDFLSDIVVSQVVLTAQQAPDSGSLPPSPRVVNATLPCETMPSFAYFNTVLGWFMLLHDVASRSESSLFVLLMELLHRCPRWCFRVCHTLFNVVPISVAAFLGHAAARTALR